MARREREQTTNGLFLYLRKILRADLEPQVKQTESKRNVVDSNQALTYKLYGWMRGEQRQSSLRDSLGASHQPNSRIAP